MKYILTVAITTLVMMIGAAQNNIGNIEFERKVYWIKIMSELPWITQEDVDRNQLTWGKRQGKPRPFVLYFNNNKSLFTYKEDEGDNVYSWKKDEYLLLRDHKAKESEDLVELLGKVYIINDKIPARKWKILNEIKEVAGYLCMKAETVDTIKNQTIHAWFTNEIPVCAGPEGFDGLPGMIMALNVNDGSLVIEATKVHFTPEETKLPIPKKMKGKEISREDYNKKVQKWVKQSIEGEKNPYWRIRY